MFDVLEKVHKARNAAQETCREAPNRHDRK